MHCKYCGVALENSSPAGAIEWWKHPGGTCPRELFGVAGQAFTLEEVRALKRVAQAQLEMETKRGSR